MNAAGARGAARVFVGLPLGAELGARVADAVAPALATARMRVPRAEGLHLTLAFLGDVARERLDGIAEALGSALAGAAAPRLVVAGTGAFPDRRRARVLWVGVEERAAPGRLAACRTAALAGLATVGLSVERADEPFRAHVTVARPRVGAGPVPAEFLAVTLGLAWDPPAVVLFESVRSEGANRYEPRARFAFRPDA